MAKIKDKNIIIRSEKLQGKEENKDAEKNKQTHEFPNDNSPFNTSPI